MNFLDNILFALLLAAGIGYFTINVKKLIRNIKLGHDVDRSDNASERWKNMAMVALGQSKMVKRPIAGFLHIIVYVGFIIFNIEVIEIIREVLTDVAEHGMTHEEIDRAKGAVRGSLVLSQEDSGSRMSRIGKNEIVYGHVMSFDDILKEISSVTHEDVRKVASEFLTKTPTLALVGPFKSESTFEKVLAKGSYR
jgi:hypothetical protein